MVQAVEPYPLKGAIKFLLKKLNTKLKIYLKLKYSKDFQPSIENLPQNMVFLDPQIVRLLKVSFIFTIDKRGGG